MNDDSLPLGIRNNNPGNVEISNDSWQGLCEVQDHKRFFKFTDSKWGIRCIARILITYQDHRFTTTGSRIDTVAEFITRWAPEFENPTNQYAQFVRDKIDVAEGEKINVYDYDVMYHMVCAIIQFENGVQPYSKDKIDQGLRLAGIEVPVKPLNQSRTVKAGTVAAASTVATGLLPVIESAKQMFEPLIPYVDAAQYGLLALTLIGTGIMVWARIDDVKKEARP